MLAGFVSCDIVGHSAVSDLSVQTRRISGINEIVKLVIEGAPIESVVWASGGDGGHIAFLGNTWATEAIGLITELQDWSIRDSVPIRITAHCGHVERIAGADGRTQLVGNGINLSGRILDIGVPGGVVVSREFREVIEQTAINNCRFHDSRTMHPKYFPNVELCLLSIDDRFTSKWFSLPRIERSRTIEGDRQRLIDALQERDEWKVIYHAKRLMQSNAYEQQAEQALEELDFNARSFLGILGQHIVTEIIRLSQLVERRRGELLCDYGDKGDSLFLVLKGKIGIFPGGVIEDDDNSDFLTPKFSVGAGEVIGELAFALKRPRTAALVATEESALLSFNVDQIQTQAKRIHNEADISHALDRFLKERILEFVCHRLPYLVGSDGKGPLNAINKPWEKMVHHATNIDLSWKENLISNSDNRFSKSGIYLLVRGRLNHDSLGIAVDGCEEVTMVFDNLLATDHSTNCVYRVETDCTLIHIDMESFLHRRPETFREVLVQVKQSKQQEEEPAKGESSLVTQQTSYDVFISYRRETGGPLARIVQQALKDHASVFLDVDKLGTGHFDTSLLETITLAPNFVVILTADSMERCKSTDDWLRKEIARALSANVNLIPVTTDGFKFPHPSELPEDIREIVRFDAVRYDHIYFESVIKKIVARLM